MSLQAILVVASLPFLQASQDSLQTVAESSGYRATATHAEVMDLIDRIEAKSTIMRRVEMGRTHEDRSIPVMIFANPPVATAEEAHASGKAIVFAFGNIHAGEICGKEALLQLAREYGLQPNHPVYEDIVLMLAPIYNGDGNDRMAPDNRRGQNGPEEGMGQRRNAQDLDLNRDYIKLDTPEARAMVAFLTEWDPHVTIDTHTTDGSRHRLALTYAAPLNPSGHAAPIEFIRDAALPEISRRLLDRTGYDTFFYGNFNRDRSVWATYSAQPRFGGPYRGLRGQMSILSEAYSYAPYKDRVIATREFVREIMRYAAERREDVLRICEQARRETIEAGLNPQPDDTIGLRHTMAAFAQPAVIHGWEDEIGENGRSQVTDRPHDYNVVFAGRFEPTLSVARPFAYVIPPGLDAVVEKLRQHGVEVESFDGAVEAEVYLVDRISKSRRPFEQHTLLTLDVTAHRARRSFAPGSILVRTAQPLGNLVVYLLEPQSEDGLATWEVFGEHLQEGAEYPVVRVPAPF